LLLEEDREQKQIIFQYTNVSELLDEQRSAVTQEINMGTRGESKCMFIVKTCDDFKSEP